MNCTRTDHRRMLDFSAIRNPDFALANAIAGLLSRRRDPMSARDIAKWFRATPEAFVETELVLMAGRGQIKTLAGARGVTKYYTDNQDD